MRTVKSSGPYYCPSFVHEVHLVRIQSFSVIGYSARWTSCVPGRLGASKRLKRVCMCMGVCLFLLQLQQYIDMLIYRLSDRFKQYQYKIKLYQYIDISIHRCIAVSFYQICGSKSHLFP